MEEKTNARQERIMNYPDSVRQSISDWELEHRECLGQALEKGIKNIIEADEFLRDHMDHVDYGYLKELWNEREENGTPTT